jgi:hypothetical protein
MVKLAAAPARTRIQPVLDEAGATDFSMELELKLMIPSINCPGHVGLRSAAVYRSGNIFILKKKFAV